ncbi:MAG: cell division protein FtsZ [Candidatus Kaiserbacteria bacterium]|nr:cell division protein FtsZ [Candidatus Kaiserbacteria bacterium]
MKKVIPPESETFARIRVVGIGGSGKNATNHMIKVGIPGVEFIVANTDSQDLQQSKAERKVHLGKRSTQGLGTGMNPMLGRASAEESLSEINEVIKGADMIFIACGMGGGTGTGAAPVIAKAAQDLGILTVSVVTKPFTFEGGKRKQIAEEGLLELAQATDAMVTIPNDNILTIAADDTTMADAFTLSDEILSQAVSGIAQLIMKPGDINIDFADIRAILENSGASLLGLGSGRGANKAEIAVTRVISSPLLEVSINGAQRALFSIASRTRSDVTMREVQTVAEQISGAVDPNAKIIFGTSTDKDMKQGEMRITLIATDFKERESEVQDSSDTAVHTEQDVPVAPAQSPAPAPPKKVVPIQSSAPAPPPRPASVPERLSDYTAPGSAGSFDADTSDDAILLDDEYVTDAEQDTKKPGWKKFWNKY